MAAWARSSFNRAQLPVQLGNWNWFRGISSYFARSRYDALGASVAFSIERRLGFRASVPFSKRSNQPARRRMKVDLS